MILNETYTLANGVKIPKLGLGTWLIENDKAADAVRNAVKAGYRSAWQRMYGTKRYRRRAKKTAIKIRFSFLLATRIPHTRNTLRGTVTLRKLPPLRFLCTT